MIIQSRADDVTVIKGQMKDVNDIFKSLATIIEGQSEMVGMEIFSPLIQLLTSKSRHDFCKYFYLSSTHEPRCERN